MIGSVVMPCGKLEGGGIGGIAVRCAGGEAQLGLLGDLMRGGCCLERMSGCRLSFDFTFMVGQYTSGLYHLG